MAIHKTTYRPDPGATPSGVGDTEYKNVGGAFPENPSVTIGKLSKESEESNYAAKYDLRIPLLGKPIPTNQTATLLKASFRFQLSEDVFIGVGGGTDFFFRIGLTGRDPNPLRNIWWGAEAFSAPPYLTASQYPHFTDIESSVLIPGSLYKEKVITVASDGGGPILMRMTLDDKAEDFFEINDGFSVVAPKHFDVIDLVSDLQEYIDEPLSAGIPIVGVMMEVFLRVGGVGHNFKIWSSAFLFGMSLDIEWEDNGEHCPLSGSDLVSRAIGASDVESRVSAGADFVTGPRASSDTTPRTVALSDVRPRVAAESDIC